MIASVGSDIRMKISANINGQNLLKFAAKHMRKSKVSNTISLGVNVFWKSQILSSMKRVTRSVDIIVVQVRCVHMFEPANVRGCELGLVMRKVYVG